MDEQPIVFRVKNKDGEYLCKFFPHTRHHIEWVDKKYADLYTEKISANKNAKLHNAEVEECVVITKEELEKIIEELKSCDSFSFAFNCKK
jgi:hypothetical protein